MQLHPNETQALEAIVIEATRLGGLTILKNVQHTRNNGKTPEYVMAECIVAAYRMWQSQGEDEPA